MPWLTNPEVPIHPILRRFFVRMGVPSDEGCPPEVPVDWSAAAPLLPRYRLRPLTHWLLRGAEREVDPELRETLESAFFAAALRYERLRAALEEIGASLWRRGLPGIVLKGMAVAERLYPEPACRPMEDIDLLVRSEDHAAAGRTLVDLGYCDLTFGPEDFRHPASGITVDLHVELLNATRLPVRRRAWRPDMETLWGRSLPFGPADLGLRTLEPRDHLHYLCHHFWLHHGLHRPLNMVDICLESVRSLAPPEPPGTLPPAPSRESRGIWYALGACRSRLGARVSEPGPPASPAGAGPVERLVQRYARQGQLPEAMRYAYLWFAVPASARWRLLPEFARSAVGQLARSSAAWRER
jgi:hypothetical protein